MKILPIYRLAVFCIAFSFWPALAYTQTSETVLTDTLATDSLGADSLSIESPIAEPPVKNDSSQVIWRPFNSETLEEIRASKDFQYLQEAPPPEGLLERLWRRIVEWLYGLFFRGGNSDVTMGAVYIMSAAVIFYAVIKLAGVDLGKVFFRKSDHASVRSQWGEAEIHGRDFDAEIRQSVLQGHYQEAIRLHYLQTLKQLSDKQLIAWKIDKTNRDYSLEIKEKRLKEPFSRLTLVFESAYYGHFPISKEAYSQISPDFSQFISQI